MRIVLFLMVAMAAIVDRVEISVGNKVITLSDIELRIRLTAFQNRVPLDLSPANRKAMAQKLIDQKLIEREIEVGHYPRVPGARLDEMMAQFTKEYPSSAAMAAELAKYGVTEAELREDLARQAELLTFIDLRFRPGDTPDLKASDERADKDLDAWLKDQRTRTRVDFLDPELAK
jgi:hypothetical protein